MRLGKFDPSYEDITENLVDYLIELCDKKFDFSNIWLTLKTRFNIITPNRVGIKFIRDRLPKILDGEHFLVCDTEKDTSIFMNKTIRDILISEIEEPKQVKITYSWEEMGIFIPELRSNKIVITPHEILSYHG